MHWQWLYKQRMWPHFNRFWEQIHELNPLPPSTEKIIFVGNNHVSCFSHSRFLFITHQDDNQESWANLTKWNCIASVVCTTKYHALDYMLSILNGTAARRYDEFKLRGKDSQEWFPCFHLFTVNVELSIFACGICIENTIVLIIIP